VTRAHGTRLASALSSGTRRPLICLHARLQIGDDDAGKLDIVLGQAYHLLGEKGDALAQGLILGATLTLRRDGGYFHPTPAISGPTPLTRPS